MKKIKKLTILFSLMFIVQTSFGQDKKKKIYFFADTISVSKENRILEIGTEGAWRYYSFFCKCIPSYSNNATFDYLIKEEKEIRRNKPNVDYISWKLLSDLIFKAGKSFNNQYDLMIVEPLSDNTYRSNNVKMYMVPPAIVDVQTIKENQ